MNAGTDQEKRGVCGLNRWSSLEWPDRGESSSGLVDGWVLPDRSDDLFIRVAALGDLPWVQAISQELGNLGHVSVVCTHGMFMFHL